jgi:hypothetical protein
MERQNPTFINRSRPSPVRVTARFVLLIKRRSRRLVGPAALMMSLAPVLGLKTSADAFD